MDLTAEGAMPVFLTSALFTIYGKRSNYCNYFRRRSAASISCVYLCHFEQNKRAFIGKLATTKFRHH